MQIDYGQRQHNFVADDQMVKTHGDPIISHHDWVVILHQREHMLCHILCFVHVSYVEAALHFDIGIDNKPQLYAICHYVN